MVTGVGLEHIEYADQVKNALRPTRASSATLEWVLSAKNGAIFYIRFDSNFAKKHLVTSTRKDANVQVELPRFSTEPDVDKRIALARRAADEAKFRRLVVHRSPAWQKCSTPGCGHTLPEHMGGMACTISRSLLMPDLTAPKKNGKVTKTMQPVKCACAKFTSQYAEKRIAQGKPLVNPLAGATGLTCDALWMDKIDSKHFEAVVVNAIVDKLAELKGQPWDAKGEHLVWDFGPSGRGAILKIDEKTGMDDWIGKGWTKVTVTVREDVVSPTRKNYVVCHLDGKKTAV